MAGTNIHPEALAAALAGAAKAPPPGYGPIPDQSGGDPSQAGAGAPPGQAPPGGPVDQTGAPPDASQGVPADQGQGTDPNQQAVWQEFPATDPGQIEQLVQALQGAGPDEQAQILGSFMQQTDADRQKLDQMHEAMLNHLLELIGGPGGAPQPDQGGAPGGPPPQGPGVGAGAGY